jgi:hypothetical protein
MMKIVSSTVVVASFFCLLLVVVMPELQMVVQASVDQKVWTKNEFKVMIHHSDCFYQTVKENAALVTSFQVIKGDDITFALTYPNGTLHSRAERQKQNALQLQHVPGGDYAVCFDNSYSYTTAKLVQVYILTFTEEKLQEKFANDQMLNETITFAKKAADNITINLMEVYTHQAMERFHQAKDAYTLQSNNDLVVYWSLTQTVLIILCAVFQAFFIKRLFISDSSKSSFSSRGASHSQSAGSLSFSVQTAAEKFGF